MSMCLFGASYSLFIEVHKCHLIVVIEEDPGYDVLGGCSASNANDDIVLVVS